MVSHAGGFVIALHDARLNRGGHALAPDPFEPERALRRPPDAIEPLGGCVPGGAPVVVFDVARARIIPRIERRNLIDDGVARHLRLDARLAETGQNLLGRHGGGFFSGDVDFQAAERVDFVPPEEIAQQRGEDVGGRMVVQNDPARPVAEGFRAGCRAREGLHVEVPFAESPDARHEVMNDLGGIFDERAACVFPALAYGGHAPLRRNRRKRRWR